MNSVWIFSGFTKQYQRMIALIAACLVSGATLANEPAVAEPAQSLSETVTACAACHGANGVSTDPMYPSLAGQYRDYLVVALKAYKSGARKNPVMAGMAAPLSKHDIEALATYFATQPGPLYTPALD